MTDGLINCKMVKDIIEEERSKIMANKGHDDKTQTGKKNTQKEEKQVGQAREWAHI